MQEIISDTVDIVIPNGGKTATLKRLLRSLKKVEAPEILHLIIVCQDWAGAEKWLREEEKVQDNLFVVFNPDNIPPPSPYNDGTDLSRSFKQLSEYIHFLDDDMEVLDGTYLQQMMDFYKANERVMLMSSEHCYFGPRPIPAHGRVPDFGMGAFFFSRELFNQLGFLDEIFDFHTSDSDYCRRTIELLKKEIAVLPGSMPMLSHKHQIGTRVAFEGKHQKIIDNDWVTFDKKWNQEVKLEFQERLVKEDRRQYWSDKCNEHTIQSIDV